MTGHTPQKLPFFRRNLLHHRSATHSFPIHARLYYHPSPVLSSTFIQKILFFSYKTENLFIADSCLPFAYILAFFNHILYFCPRRGGFHIRPVVYANPKTGGYRIRPYKFIYKREGFRPPLTVIYKYLCVTAPALRSIPCSAFPLW